MIEQEKRNAIFLLSEGGMSDREISRRLHVSRNTVQSIIAQGGEMPVKSRDDEIVVPPELLTQLFADCDGYVQRIHEKLVEEKGIAIGYSTLTKRVRKLGLGRDGKDRCDKVEDVPGAEMQHDTSPYVVKIGDREARRIASLLYFRYSKRKYLKFYRRFDRFRMKCFLHEALTHFGRSAKECIIDNTNLARLRGTGKNAVIVPEMEVFAKQHGFNFICHEKGHCNRKAGEERSFWTVETNFLPGRSFEDDEDLNRQALEWSTVRMDNRPVKRSGLIPAKAFEYEIAFLNALPPHLPAPYLLHERGTDQYGFAALDSNFYFVPGTGRDDVSLHEYSEHVKIYRGRELLIEYPLPREGVKNQRFYPEGYTRPRHAPKNRKKPTTLEEERLRAIDPTVAAWLDSTLPAGGITRHHLVRDLFGLSQQMTPPLFVKSVARALQYRIRSVETIRRIAHMYMSEGLSMMPLAEVDARLLERDEYVEGRLTDAPDFSAWKGMLETDEEKEESDE